MLPDELLHYVTDLDSNYNKNYGIQNDRQGTLYAYAQRRCVCAHIVPIGSNVKFLFMEVNVVEHAHLLC